jgi:hypothetical protein
MFYARIDYVFSQITPIDSLADLETRLGPVLKRMSPKEIARLFDNPKTAAAGKSFLDLVGNKLKCSIHGAPLWKVPPNSEVDISGSIATLNKELENTAICSCTYLSEPTSRRAFAFVPKAARVGDMLAIIPAKTDPNHERQMVLRGVDDESLSLQPPSAVSGKTLKALKDWFDKYGQNFLYIGRSFGLPLDPEAWGIHGAVLV